MTEYVDRVWRENASRATANEAPLSYREMKERWTDLIEKRAPFMQRQTGKAGGATGSGNSYGRGGSGGATRGRGGQQRAGSSAKGRGAKHNGNSVCYHYNNAGGCKRQAKGGGCDNGSGGEYAHVCNFETSTGRYCLAAHPKVGNH